MFLLFVFLICRPEQPFPERHEFYVIFFLMEFLCCMLENRFLIQVVFYGRPFIRGFGLV
jgi:hypothetical protein